MDTKGHILVVDDDMMIILFMENFFMKKGYKVSSVESGDEALKFLNQYDPDIILLDVNMPDMNGYDTCEEIRMQGITIPIIFITGQTEEKDIKKCYAVGGNDYIRKPFLKEEVFARVNTQLENQKVIREMDTLNENLDTIIRSKVNELNLILKIMKQVQYFETIDDLCTMVVDTIEEYFSIEQYEACIVYNKKSYRSKEYSKKNIIAKKKVEISKNRIMCLLISSSKKDYIQKEVLDDFVEILTNEVKQIIDYFEILIKENEYKVFLTAILDSSPDGILVLDDKANIIQLNPASRELFDLNYKQIIGSNIKEIFNPFNLNNTGVNIFEEIKNKGHYYFELINYKVNDKKINLSITGGSLLRDLLKYEYLLICKNINQRIEMETQIQSSSKMESIGRLAAGIAHEINSPVQFIRNNADFISESMVSILKFSKKISELVTNSDISMDDKREELKDDLEELDLEFINDEMQDALKESIEGINRITKIINAMRTFSHPGTDNMKKFFLNDVINNAIIVSRNEWKYVAELEVDYGLDQAISIYIDKISQVILNLIINASHAIQDLKREELGKIKISTKELDNGFAEIRVEDNGIGIPQKIIDKIYEPFFTTKEVGKGTGQGLSVIYNIIVKNHNGTIDCESVEGKGTTFIIRLPIENSNSQEND